MIIIVILAIDDNNNHEDNNNNNTDNTNDINNINDNNRIHYEVHEPGNAVRLLGRARLQILLIIEVHGPGNNRGTRLLT